MRIHTTAVPATKYLPERIHVKLTNDQDVPNNIKDKTYNYSLFDSSEDEQKHRNAALHFAGCLGYTIVLKTLGETLTRRGWKYEVVEIV